MSLKQFSENDIFRNSLVLYPRYEFRIANGEIKTKNYVDGELKFEEIKSDDYVEEFFGELNFQKVSNSGIIPLI